jgi:deoxyadenosine/deoxycytidine kinase
MDSVGSIDMDSVGSIGCASVYMHPIDILLAMQENEISSYGFIGFAAVITLGLVLVFGLRHTYLYILNTLCNKCPKAKKIYIIDGEIGAGKTTLVRSLTAHYIDIGLDVCTIPEPVHLWNETGILQKFYADPVRYTYSFQTYATMTRVKAITDAFIKQPNADVYIVERSPATDKLFMELQRTSIEPIEVKMYDTWCDTWNQLLPIDIEKMAQPIYLKTSINSCMDRVHVRNRDGEKCGVTADYQQKLRLIHEAFFEGKHATVFPLLKKSKYLKKPIVIDETLADVDFRDIYSDEFKAILNRIENTN